MGQEPNQKLNYENSKWNYQMRIKLTNETSCVPAYGSDGAGCLDFYVSKAYTTDDWEPVVTYHNRYNEGRRIVVGYRLDVPLGIEVEVPVDYTLDLYSRSGHAKKFNCTLANSVGIIDSDFRGEVVAMLYSPFPFEIVPSQSTGMVAVCQGKLVHAPHVYVEIVDELSSTQRGKNGFGSTDK